MRLPRALVLLPVLLVVVLGLQAQDAPPANPAPAPGGNAPGGGRWNPAEMQQRFMTAIKEQLKATDEDWKVIEPRLKAVMDKEQAARQLSSRGGFFRRGGQNDQPAAEVAAVTKAIEGGDAATIKTALAALRKARTDREAETTKAKDALREVLTVAQEAQLVLNGLLN